MVNSRPVLIMGNENNKENCAHCFINEKLEDCCNIGNIQKCNECSKFYHNDWLKSDMESENYDK